MTRYLKPSTSPADQLNLLKRRGLAVPDPERAVWYLQRVGYYRLMGYLFPQRLPLSDDYLPGASIVDAIEAYELDCGLRRLVMEAVGHIEIAVKSRVTNHFTLTYGPFGHHDTSSVAFDHAWHEDWMGVLGAEVRRSKETFLLHYKTKYTNPPFPFVPLWMASEVMSFGTTSRFYGAMHPADQKRIAHDFALRVPVLKNWLHFTSVVRNVAAHHGRLWNRELGVRPVRPHGRPWSETMTPFPTARCFYMLLVLRYLLGFTTADVDDWRRRVTRLLERHLQDDRRIDAMGVGPGWQAHPLWLGTGQGG